MGVLPIRRDQRQRLWRPIFLNAASSHVLPCTSDTQCSHGLETGQSGSGVQLEGRGASPIPQRGRGLGGGCQSRRRPPSGRRIP
jgi:hypothetical protein